MGSHTLSLEDFVSISRGWKLFCGELIRAEDSPHITVQCITTFKVVLAFLLVSVCCDSPSLGVLAGVSVL